MGMALLGLAVFAGLIVVPVWLFSLWSRAEDLRLQPVRMTADPRPWDPDRARWHDKR